MKTTIRTLCIALGIVLGASASAPAFADRGHHRGYDAPPARPHHGGHPHGHHGHGWGAPAVLLAITGLAAGIAAATYYSPPQREVYAPPPPAYPAPAEGYWHYCASAGQYYPYVRYCEEGWQTVYP